MGVGQRQRGRAKGGKRGLVRRPFSVPSFLASLSFDAFSHPYLCSEHPRPPRPREIKTYSIVVVVTTDSNGCPDDWRNKHFTRISAQGLFADRVRAV